MDRVVQDDAHVFDWAIHTIEIDRGFADLQDDGSYLDEWLALPDGWEDWENDPAEY